MENLDDEKPSDKELLDQLCSSLPQRTHEDKRWADVGILQYQRQEKRSLESEKEKSNKVEKAEGVDLQVSWTVAVKKVVLSEKEDTEAFHEKLGDKPAAEEQGKDEPVPKRRLTTKGQPGK
eukprot:s5293_g3.t1